MELLIKQPYRCDFELRYDTLYLYYPYIIDSKIKLDSLLTFAQAISHRIVHEIRTMHVSPEVAAVGQTPDINLTRATNYALTALLNTLTYGACIVGPLAMFMSLLLLASPDPLARNDAFVIFFTTSLTITIIGCLLWLLRRRPV